jgi:hypothetical protein
MSRSNDRDARGGSPFRYKERDPEVAKKRLESAGSGGFDSFLPDTVKVFKAAAGDNRVRILPPAWEDAEHYGLEVFVHYDVGPDKVAYLCLEKMKGKPCPVCEERKRAAAAGDTEYADTLRPAARVLYYVLDRNREREGVQVWSVGRRMDGDIMKVGVDREAGEVLAVDHPTKGFDLMFTREGEKMKTRYSGFQFARRASPVDNDDALEQIQEVPLPTVLRYYSYDHMLNAFGGGSGSERDAPKRSARGQDEDPPARRGRDEEPPVRSKAKELPTWEEVHAMSFRKLSDLCDEHKLRVDPSASRDDAELANDICEELDIKAARTRTRAADPDEETPVRERLRSFKE